MANPTTSTITWLGHSTVRIDTPDGKALYIEAWLEGNPACPDGMKSPDRMDTLLITHGHFDHLGETVELARKHNPRIVCTHEISVWLGSKGIENVVGMNKGGTVDAGGIPVTMVHADHSCGIQDGDDLIYGGDAAGFVVTLPDGFKVYHAGDTDVFGDMKLIGELHRPDLAMLPIGGHYTMSPREAALAVKLLGVSRVIPIHYGTFPILTGSPAALRDAVGSGVEVIELERGGRWGGE